MNPEEQIKEWIVEWFFRHSVNKRGYWVPLCYAGSFRPYPECTITKAMKVAVERQRKFPRNAYRIRNINTDDVLPARIL